MGETIRVLHVDDDRSVLDLTSTYLRRADERFSVATATDVDGGLAHLAEQDVDCIVSDYEMPGETGIEFLEAVRADHPDLPFILFTGKGSEAVASEAISAGVTDYLQKRTSPEQYELLANRIDHAVAQYDAERRATRTARRLEAILEHTTTPMFMKDADGEYVLVNDGYRELFGFSEGEVVGRTDPDLFPKEMVREVRANDRQVLETGEPLDVEETILVDGEERTFLSSKVPIYDTEGERDGPVAVFGVAKDITERKVRERERRYEAIFDQTYQFIGLMEPDGTLLEANDTALAFAGIEESDVLGKPFWEAHWWQTGETTKQRLRDAIDRAADGEFVRYEADVRGEDETITIDFSIRPVTDDDGEVTYLIPEGRNISEMASVREWEPGRYDTLVENLPVGVFRTTPDGDVIDVNSTFVEMFGAGSRETARELATEGLWADPDERDALIEDVEREGVVERRAVELETLDGEPRWMEVTVTLSEEDGDRYLDGVLVDVTGQRDDRRRLEQTEVLFEHAQDALFLVDVGEEEFRVERINPAYEAATGLSASEVVGRTPAELFPDNAPAMTDSYERCVRTREPQEYDEQLPIGGEQTYWETRIAPVVVDGEVEYIAGATRNVTDREQRIRDLERYETILETIDDVAFVVREDRTVGYVNDTIERYVEAPRDALLGEHVGGLAGHYLVGPGDPERFDEALDRAFGWTGDGPPDEDWTERLELRLATDDGTAVFEYQLSPIVDDGTVDAVAVTMRDITDRKERERELRRSRDLLRHTEQLADTGGWEIDADTGEQRWTDGTYAVHDLDPDGEFAPTVESGLSFYHPDDRDVIENAVDRCIETGEPYDERLRLVTDEGRLRWVRTRGKPVEADGEVVQVRGAIQDVTEYEQQRRQLQRQNERLDEFTSVVSHDLRNPLGVASGYLEMAREECDSAHLDDVETVLERMERLIDDLLALAREGESATDPETLPLDDVVRRCWENVGTGDASVTVATDRSIRADHGRLQQLLENLLHNAAEHGGGQVTVGTLEEGFYVEDDGPGLPADDPSKVFEVGYTTSQDGTGFGLSIVERIAEEHGWSVTAVETDDGGARFEVTDVALVE